MTDLVPPDRERCQAEKPNGHNAFTLGGVPGMVRCGNKPLVIATEVRAGADGKIGSMSVCGDCMKVMQEQLGAGFCTFEEIKR